MKKTILFIHTHATILFYMLWFVLSLFQIAYTELMHDEAYYWAYSTQLDWGYFDHPPMIAVMIKWGYAFFHNELGVRLLAVGMNVLVVFIIEKIVNPKNKPLFYVLVSSIAFLQLGSILAIPDSPLLFFSVCFFYVFKKYLEADTIKNALLLSGCMALLIYSKYHGILLLFFLLFAQYSTLKKGFVLGTNSIDFDTPCPSYQLANTT